MGINTQKILLIRNVHPDFAPLSTAAADYYADARGLRDSNGLYYHLDFSIPSWGTDEYKFLTDRAYAPPFSTNPDFNSTNRINIDEYRVAGKSAKITDPAITASTRMLEAVGRAIATYGIQAVFVTPGFPVSAGGFSGNASNPNSLWQPIECYLSYAARYWTLPVEQRGFVSFVTAEATAPAVAAQIRLNPALGVNIAFKHQPGAIPNTPGRKIMYGRIGWADPSQSFSQLGAADQVGTVRYIVENAKASELKDNRDAPHLIGGCAYIDNGWWDFYQQCNNLAWDQGIRSRLFHLPTGAAGCRGTLLPGSESFVYRAIVAADCPPGTIEVPTEPFPGGDGWAFGDISSAIFCDGVLPPNKYVNDGAWGAPLQGIKFDPPLTETLPRGSALRMVKYAFPLPTPPERWFCMFYSNGSQLRSDYEPGGLVNQFNQFAPGGWVLKWQSSAYIMAVMCLKTGGSLAIANYSEPYASGLPAPLEYMTGILAGLSGTEVLYRCGPGKNSSAWGDPLYAPYRATSPAINTVFDTSLE